MVMGQACQLRQASCTEDGLSCKVAKDASSYATAEAVKVRNVNPQSRLVSTSQGSGLKDYERTSQGGTSENTRRDICDQQQARAVVGSPVKLFDCLFANVRRGPFECRRRRAGARKYCAEPWTQKPWIQQLVGALT